MGVELVGAGRGVGGLVGTVARLVSVLRAGPAIEVQVTCSGREPSFQCDGCAHSSPGGSVKVEVFAYPVQAVRFRIRQVGICRASWTARMADRFIRKREPWRVVCRDSDRCEDPECECGGILFRDQWSNDVTHMLTSEQPFEGQMWLPKSVPEGIRAGARYRVWIGARTHRRLVSESFVFPDDASPLPTRSGKCFACAHPGHWATAILQPERGGSDPTAAEAHSTDPR